MQLWTTRILTMPITRTRITVDRVQTSFWIFLEGEEDNEGGGDGCVHADTVDAETAVGDGEDDDVPVDINNSPEPKRATERLIHNDYYSITQDWMIHFSLPISLFFVVLLVFAWFILIWIGVFGFFCCCCYFWICSSFKHLS